VPADDPKRPRPPDPEALLAAAVKAGRGRLKVFLGMAPGVGKTYEMLRAARRRKADGQDVLIGLVETHGRRETESLLRGMEVLPRKPIDHRGHVMMEFDLDTALARRPALLLVDEYAHSNAPGSRHPKRWQDVEELLAAGIDVWTTLNVQHLESLVDVVQRITGVRQRETVPDSALSRADAIELIDITPDELRERLGEGKVYVPETARLASENFFKVENLTALRELALRRAAQTVDDQLVATMREKGVEGPWAAGERILVLVGGDAMASGLVRAGRRLSDMMMDAPVDGDPCRSPGPAGQGAGGRGPAARRPEAGRAAGRLDRGAQRRRHRRHGDGLRPPQQRHPDRHRQVGRQPLARAAGPVAGGGPAARGARSGDPRGHRGHARSDRRAAAPPTYAGLDRLPARRRLRGRRDRRGLGPGRGLRPCGPGDDLPGRRAGGRGAARIAAGPGGGDRGLPRLQLHVPGAAPFVRDRHADRLPDPGGLLGRGPGGRRAGGAGARPGPRRPAAGLGGLGPAGRQPHLLGGAGREAAAKALAEQTAAAVGAKAVVLLPANGELQPAAGAPTLEELDAAPMAAARWAWERGEAGGVRHRHPAADPLDLLAAGGRALAGRGGRRRGGRHGGRIGRRALLLALLEQGAVALERAELATEAVETETLRRADRFRSALLNSISHDLRTPLSTVLGASSTLIDYGKGMTAAVRDDLLLSIREEAERLNRYVGNLLDMTRLEGGALRLRTDWTDVRDVLGAAAERVSRRLETRVLARDFPVELSLVRADPSLLEQAVVNILENAIAYSQDGARIEMAAYEDRSNVVISIEDEGRGIPTAELEQVFEKFRRMEEPTDRHQGAGLGLSISKGFVDAMGGRIAAASPIHDGKGTRILISLPKAIATPHHLL
jgi:two-component system sensor histidine kinase KdpD